LKLIDLLENGLKALNLLAKQKAKNKEKPSIFSYFLVTNVCRKFLFVMSFVNFKRKNNGNSANNLALKIQIFYLWILGTNSISPPFERSRPDG
jgi:hypothetical protein